MKRGRLGWGIIGCGVIGYWHDLAVRKNADRAQVVAYCDMDQRRAEEFNSRYAGGRAKVYTDFRRLVRDPQVDVVSVCTPSGLHLDPVLAAAEAGKHILCEKPIEIKLDRIDRMIESAEAHRVKLAVVFQRRTYESARKVKTALDQGLLGRMILGDARMKYFRSQDYYDSGAWRGTWALDGGGALMNQGIHGIDLLLWFMGDVRSVLARTRTLSRNIETEDTAAALLEYTSGALGVIEGATAANPGEPTRLELHGVRGTIVYEETRIVKWAVGGDENALAQQVPLSREEACAGGGQLNEEEMAALGHIRHVADLIDAIHEDRAPLVTGREARRSVELILAVYESSRTGREVVLR